MTITAGAHSSQPSRRSARAPSDSRLRPLAPVTVGSAVTTSVPVVIGLLPFCAFRPCWPAGAPGPEVPPGRSWDQPLRRQGVIDLAGHVLLGAHRLDGG